MIACDRCGRDRPAFMAFRSARGDTFIPWCDGCFLRFMAYTIALSFVVGALVAWNVHP